jgi:uncharacterized protein (TIGR02145 family)
MKSLSASLCFLFIILSNGFSQTITTGAVTSPKCAGTTFNLTYSKSGTFTAGNIFTAQLSNAAGSFTSLVNIGTLTSTLAGTIVCTIPANTASGTGYRVRVVSSAPVRTGSINNSNITINALLTPEVTISSSASGSICSSTSATLTAVALNGGSSPVYSWYKNGISVGTSSNVYSASSWIDKDSIICVLTSNASCVTSTKDTSNLKVMDVYRDTLSSWRRRNDLFHPELSHGGNRSFSIGNYGYVLFGDSLWRYDPTNDNWLALTQYPGNGIAAAVAFAIENKAYVGFGSGGEFYEYDVVSNVWTAKANYPGGLGNNCTFSIGSKGYVTNSNTFWCYDPINNTWIQKSSIPYLNSPIHNGFAFSIGNKGYAGGGDYWTLRAGNSDTSNWCSSENFKNDFYEYDPIADIWVQKSAISGLNSCAFTIGNNAYLGLSKGRVYCDYSQPSSSYFFQYNQLSDTWNNIDVFLGGGRYSAFAFSIGNRGFVGGGVEYSFNHPYGGTLTDTTFHDLFEYRNIIQADSLSIPYCPGQNISLSFNTNCKNFNTDNVFTAQISDRFGNFNNGHDIGNLASVNSGQIIAIIPNGLPSGDDYKIRIVASAPYYIGKEVPIKINPIVTPITITGNSNIYLCNQSPYHYAVENASTANYVWSITGAGNSIVSGQGSNAVDLNLSSAGSLSVTASINNACGNTAASSNFTIYNQLPSVPEAIKKSFNPLIDADATVNQYLQSIVNSTNVADTFRIKRVNNAVSYLWSVPDSATKIIVNDTTIAVVFFDKIKFVPNIPQYIKVSAVTACSISNPLLLPLNRNVVFPKDDNRVYTICSPQTLKLSASYDTLNTVTDNDGNVYPTVQIGNQLWMAKNLAVNSPGALGYNSNYDGANLGYLYSGIAGINPIGWHVPSIWEMNNLQNALLNENVANKLKETGTTHWNAPNNGATNETRFTALPGGSYNENMNDSVMSVGDIGVWWTTDTNPVWWEHGFPWDYHWEYYPVYFTINNGDPNLGYYYTSQFYYQMYASVRCLRDAPALTYQWSNGATTRTISVSPTTTTTYYCTISDGLGYVVDSFKVNVSSSLPAAPLTIYGATDACSSIASNSVSAPVRYYVRKVTNAISYNWTVPTGVTIISGQGDTAIDVTFSSSFVSGVISVKSVNSCGTSTSARSITVYKRIAAAPAAIQKEFSPTSVVAVTNVCGVTSSVYRIKKVTYATSYNWYLNIGSNATITHVNASGINDTAVVVNFLNGFTKDTLSVKSVTACNISLAKTVIMNAALLPPAVTAISGKLIPCIGEVVVFVASSTAPTTAQSSISVFRWTKPNYTVITYANADSSVINLQFNTGFTGGSITAKGQSLCGISGTAKSVTLQYLPPTPTSITSSTGLYNACIGSPITFTAVIPALSTTQRAATVYRWTKPNNTTILSATVDSLSITLQFNAGYTGGSLTVKGQTACGATGTAKSQALTHTACPTGTKNNPIVFTKDKNDINFNVTLFPNPTTTGFNLKVFSAETKTASIKIMDVQGRLIKTLYALPQQTISFGNDFKSGVYMLEVSDGLNKKSIRAVKY